jgi:hypothetical protein
LLNFFALPFLSVFLFFSIFSGFVQQIKMTIKKQTGGLAHREDEEFGGSPGAAVSIACTWR